MTKKINQTVIMSSTDYFNDGFAINAYMGSGGPMNSEKARAEHQLIAASFESAGIKVIRVPAPADCQDGVYAANWALIVGDKAIMANLPNKREAEQPHAEKILSDMGKTIVKLPREIHFSGQGDALPCGNYLFTGTTYRTSPEAHALLAKETGLNVISLQTIPQLDENGQPVINAVTGWPDSFFYDIDLAISIIRPDLIAWCPEAFLPESQEKIRAISDIEKIEVSMEEAQHGFACNLVSTGETVIMGDRAPELKKNLETVGLKIITPAVTELLRGGGFIRCTSLTTQ